VVVLSVRGARGEKVKRGSEDERGGVGLGRGHVSYGRGGGGEEGRRPAVVEF
jgi:hypothetical protein